MIEIKNISKDFKIYKRPKGAWNVVKSAFHREYELRKAVKDISFKVNQGEIVGYVGPNGAGKSTTIKMLSGVLTPTSGNITVNGIVPYKQRVENAKHIGVVFGQRSQLYWDLPVKDSFTLHEKMYEIPAEAYKRNVDMFIEILGMERFLDQPVRQLSLGQKMRANIALSLLHDPELVYLDEATIGLDIVAKAAIRDFVVRINREKGTTFMITTHDMGDIESMCNRLIMIDEGVLRYDGALSDFKAKFGEKYTISVTFKHEAAFSHENLQVIKSESRKLWLLGDKHSLSVADAVTYLTHNYEIEDIAIEESDIESILREMYTKDAI